MKITLEQIPAVSDLDMAFPTMKADLVLLEIAEKEGFYGGYTPYNKLFSKAFYEGCQVTYKEGLDPELRKRAGRYLRALMGSFAPKHEEKEAVCALIMSEILIAQ